MYHKGKEDNEGSLSHYCLLWETRRPWFAEERRQCLDIGAVNLKALSGSDSSESLSAVLCAAMESHLYLFSCSVSYLSDQR